MSSSGGSVDHPIPVSQTNAIKPDFTRRCIALLIDVAVAYFLGISISIIPWIRDFVSLTPTIILYLLIRDFLFEGRGVGKNMMGLQIVDAGTGSPPSISQSLRRNIVLLAPFVVMLVLNELCRLIPALPVKEALIEVVRFAGTIYYLVLLPMETYRAYSRPDGLRLADRFAGTRLIESAMDFSKMLPKH